MQLFFTIEQILSLAPDSGIARHGQILASAEKWEMLQQSPKAAWGEFPVVRRGTIQTAVDLNNWAITCTCRSRNFPCNHALSLLLLIKEKPDTFKAFPEPEWVKVWRQDSRLTTDHAALTTTQLHDLQAGLRDLELWLRDLIGNGLGTLPSQPKRYWDDMINRMVDIRAPKLRDHLQYLRTLPQLDGDWPREFLSRIGRIYLLTQAFQRFDQLTAHEQADCLLAVGGWPAAGENDVVLSDKWLVVSNQLTSSKYESRQDMVVWGYEHNQPVQVRTITRGKRTVKQILPTGTQFTGDIRLLAGSSRQHGVILTVISPQQPTTPVVGQDNLLVSHTAFANALAQSPWLDHFPLFVRGVSIDKQKSGWQVRDQHGTILPLNPPEKLAWHLHALAEQNEVSLFGIWDGRALNPHSVWYDGRLLKLKILRGLR